MDDITRVLAVLVGGRLDTAVGVVEPGRQDEGNVVFAVTRGKAEGIFLRVAEDVGTSKARVGINSGDMDGVVMVLGTGQRLASFDQRRE